MSEDPDRAKLIRFLVEQGASAAELEEAQATGTLGPLALELAIRSRGERMTFAEAAKRAGLELDYAAAVWRALGFPDPLLDAAPDLTEDEAATLELLARMAGPVFGQETTLQLARVIGGSVAQIAEAIVDAFRITQEMPRRASGEPSSTIVGDYARMAGAMIPVLGSAITDTLAAHLVTVSRAGWALDAAGATVTRERAVGFVDLVDFTSRTRLLAPAELAATIGSFETLVADLVSRAGGRLVKLIGDEAMFVIGDPAGACRLAVELHGALARQPEGPQARIGLAAGPVVSHRGDYFGDVVNLAARLVKVAEPGAVLVSAPLATALDGWALTPVEVPPLKGYDEPVPAYRLELPKSR
ncbi:MAG: adenylate cyclase regulatory domain-containing protein [Solirubrobacteraceae bacterium]